MSRSIKSSIGVWAVFCITIVILQVCSLFLGTVGKIISTFACLPLAVAVISSPISGMALVLVSTFLLFIINPTLSAIFFFVTAPFSYVIGAGIFYKKPANFYMMFSIALLIVGNLLCTYGFKVDVLWGTIVGNSAILSIFLTVILSVIYCWVWYWVINWINQKVLYINIVTK